MVAVKGEESRQLHPAGTQRHVGIAVEAAGVDAEHGNTKRGEGKRLRDGKHHIGPQTRVVTAPVASPLSGACKSRAADDEGTLAGEDGQQGVVGSV